MGAMNHNALNAIGKTYGNFTVTKYCPLPELQATLIELVHLPSGATVMHIEKDDPENFFCLSFQTLPASSNGVAHILEHTVLCGSQKYPVKDPFFSMTRRSLNTFMNAFTGQDFTCYPASSQVEKDFYNLLEVYLDAVFHPNLTKTSFLQEGHRLEFAEPKNSESPLQFQGIVYNEMKGAMSSPDDRLWDEIAKRLLPDLPYAFNSGGDPKEIPNLTHEELIEFHQTYYHPSRCIFFFYGDLPLAKHLDFIEKQTLSSVQKIAQLPPLPSQRRFSEPVYGQAHYPSESEDATFKLSFCWLTTPLSNQADVLALSVVESYLFETDASPLKMALLKSGLCKDVESHLDVEISEVPFMITLNGCSKDSEKKIQKVLFDTLAKIASSVDMAQIEAALHQLEIQRTEIGAEGGPFGLTLFFRAGLIKHHGIEAEQALMIHSLFSEIREKIKNPDYIPSLIRNYLIDNTHLVIQKMVPDPTLGEKEKLEEEAKLKLIQENLSAEKKETIIQQSIDLLKAQEQTEHQSIDCLPKVSLSDIPQRAKDFPLSTIATDSLTVYTHECFTNGLLYADFLFDLPHIAVKDLSLLSLLVNLWTDLGCGGKSYEETLQFMQAYTGGIDATLTLHVCATNPNVLRPSLSFRGKAMEKNSEKFFELLSAFAQGPNFTEKGRVHEWLLQHVSELENDLVENAQNYATQLSLSNYSVASFIYNQWNGLPYYQFVLNARKNKNLIERLATLAKSLCKGKPELILGCSAEQKKCLQASHFFCLGSWKPILNDTPWQGNYPLDKHPSQAHLIPAPVAFTAMGLRTVSFQDPDAAELMLATLLLKHIVLHKEIREKGGAYGGGASYAPNTGNFHFTAYRDPNLSSSIAAFKSSIEIIGSGGFSARELEEAKISLLGSIDTPVVPCGRAIVAYAWLRANRTLEQRQTLRDQILATTKEKVALITKKRLQNTPATIVSFLGNELWKKEEKLVDLTLIDK